MRVIASLLAASLWGLWWTADQMGQRQFRRGEFEAAAESFQDPLWQGTAWFRAGEFEKSVQAFSQIDSAESHYNMGNAWVMLGKYDRAVASYDQALQHRPQWKDAQENRDLAAARGERLKSGGGDMGDQKLGADEIVFDKDKKSGGQDTEVAGEQATSSASVQALWLRQVQTEPAGFLKSKFAYQQTMKEQEQQP